MSYSGFGQVETVATETLGGDRSRQPYPTDARFWISSATWAQRGINAAHARLGRSLIVVDGRAGPVTVGALRELGIGLPPSENYPVGARITDRVLIPRALADRLASYAPVRDPRSATRTAATSTAPAPAEVAPSPGPPGGVVAEEPGPVVSTRRSLTPWLLGAGVGLVGLGVVFMATRPQRVRANRRRRRSR